METNKKYLWKYEKDLYYARVNGIFLATEEDIQAVFSKTRTLHLGERAGKWSEVDLDLSMKDFTKLPSGDLDEDQLETFCLGTDPLSYFLEYHTDNMYADSEEEINEYLKENDIQDLKDIIIRQKEIQRKKYEEYLND